VNSKKGAITLSKEALAKTFQKMIRKAVIAVKIATMDFSNRDKTKQLFSLINNRN